MSSLSLFFLILRGEQFFVFVLWSSVRFSATLSPSQIAVDSCVIRLCPCPCPCQGPGPGPGPEIRSDLFLI